MAAINFPDSPTLNQEHTDDNGFTWKWNGTVWRGSTGTRQAAIIEVADTAGNFTGEDVEAVLAELADADDTKVAKSGDTMTGNLTIDTDSPRVTIEGTTPGLELKRDDGTRAALVYHIESLEEVRVRTYDSSGSPSNEGIIIDTVDGSVDLSDAPSVSVPNASAAGEAIANRQAGATLSGVHFRTSQAADYGVVLGFLDDERVRLIQIDDNSFRFQITQDGGATWSSAWGYEHGDDELSVYKPIKVPDASADGEALAYDQANWRLGAGEITGNLTVDGGAFPAIDIEADTAGYLTFSDGSGTEIGHISWNASTGLFRIHGKSDRPGASATTNFMQVTSDDVVSFAAAAEVDVPAISGANQAAQVTAYNATTGQLQIGGHEVGDTGWRSVPGSIINGWTVSGARLRRIGNTVHLFVYGLNGSATSVVEGPAANHWFSCPTGFVWDQVCGVIHQYNAQNGSTAPTHGASTTMFSPWTGTNGYLGLVWATDAAWPASLPGTAI